MNEVLVGLGIALLSGSALAAVISVAVFSVTGRRLRKKLDEEYGRQQNG